MEKKIEEFIGIYDGAFSPEYCEEVIEKFETLDKIGFAKTRQELNDHGKLGKDDTSIWTGNLLGTETNTSSMNQLIGEKFSEVFWGEAYPHYSENFDVLNQLPQHTIYGNKVQRTKVGQGYHVWHCEHANGENANRILTFVVYLNDVEEGGETEFLYQKKRYTPKQGTMVIFPAGYTHTHRGNPPLSNDKYIMTGWVEY